MNALFFIRRLTIVFAALLLMAAPTAYALPPAGDTLAAPVAILVNSGKTIDGAEAATNLDGAFEASTCDGNASSANSVWFSLTLPAASVLDIDSAGTLLQLAASVRTFVVLTVYQYSPGPVLNQTNCVFGDNARLTSIPLSAGEYRIRIANDAGSLAGASRYRLHVRARAMDQFLQEPVFETSDLGVVWKAKNAGNPAQIYRFCTATCGIRFNGAAGGLVQQTVDFDPSPIKWVPGDLLRADVSINNTPVTGADVKLTLKIIYTGGTPVTKVSATRHITDINTGIVTSPFGGLYAVVASKAVKSVKFIVTSPQADDTFSLKHTLLSLYAGSGLRDSVLPPPPASLAK